MRGNCSVVVIMNQLGIMWDAGASVGVLVACLLLIAEQNAHQICLTNCKLFAIQWHGTAVCAASTPLTFFYWTYKYVRLPRPTRARSPPPSLTSSFDLRTLTPLAFWAHLANSTGAGSGGVIAEVRIHES